MTTPTQRESPSFGDDRDWLLRFCTPASAAALQAVFDIEREILASLRPDLEHSVAHARLAWWEEELTRLATGAPRHPSTRALAGHAAMRNVSPPDLRRLIEHARVDLAAVAFLTRQELDEHLTAWSKSIFRAIALLETGENPVIRAAAERLAAGAGPSVRELELTREFSRFARAGRIYMPLGDPPQSHEIWIADPLAPAEQDTLDARRCSLVSTLKSVAHSVETEARAALRVPLLWMAFAVAPRTPRVARLAPLARTISTWRGALALNRGGLPAALS